jgi:hypothetical protein
MFETAPYGGPVQLSDLGQRRDRVVDAADDTPGDAILDDLGHRPAGIADDGGSAGHRLDHDRSERFRPPDREEQRASASEEFRFLRVRNLAHVFDLASIDMGPDRLFAIWPVERVDPGCEFQRHPRAARDLDRGVDPLVRRDPSEKGEIAARPVSGLARKVPEQVPRVAVIDRRRPVGVGKRPALCIRDRD